MDNISKQLTCQKFIFKIHSERLRREKWNLTLPLSEARKNDEVIALADSQVLRWIDELNGLEDSDSKARLIKREIKWLKKQPYSMENKKKVRKLYEELDNVQFKPDYMCLIIDKDKDYRQACKGFKINGVEYERLVGTNGGVKMSTIVFASKRLTPELKRRIDNGRNLDKPIVPAKLEAYRALACSASIPVSFPNGVAVVDDCETTFFSDFTYLSDENDGDPLMEFRPNQEVKLDASDGFGLMMPSLADRWSKELGLDYQMAGCNTRVSWEKGMVYTFDFVSFGERVANSYIIKDAWGNDIDVRNVELILTTSMLKLWDSYKSIDDYLENTIQNNYTFGIPKVCPKKLDNVRSLNYQFIQSYNLTDEEVDELIQPTIDEIEDTLGGDWVKTVLFLKGSGMTDDNIKYQEDDIAKAIMIDRRMMDDPYVKSVVHNAIKKRIDDAKIGVLNVHGNFSIASGDPYALCQSMFGLEVTGLLKSNQVYNKYWIDCGSEKLACYRAPMTSHANIRTAYPTTNDEIEYWYQYMDTCTIFNAWDTSCAALNGMD